MVQLYRGIKVSKSHQESFKENVMLNGIKMKVGKSGLAIEDLRDHLEELFHKPDLSTSDTRNQEKKDNYTFVTADQNTAAYYATRDVKADEVPLIIHFEASFEDLMIDGRDFLATVFQRSIQQKKIPLIKDILIKMYGEQILYYYDKALMSKEVEYKLAMYDLAMQNHIIIKGHLNNQLLVEGRFQVPITSVYFCKIPIRPEKIHSITVAEVPSFEYDYKINDLF